MQNKTIWGETQRMDGITIYFDDNIILRARSGLNKAFNSETQRILQNAMEMMVFIFHDCLFALFYFQ